MASSSPRAFRFGVVHSETPRRMSSWSDFVREIDSQGFQSLLKTDHIGEQLAVGPALATAAAISDRLRVGSLVYNNNLYHPVVLAREAATLANLCGGRFELGLGAGWDPRDYARAGVAMVGAGTRIARLVETIEIIRSCFAGGPFTFEGRHYRVDADMSPAPLLQPDAIPPLLIGGGGERMLQLAGRFADIVSINPRMRDTEFASWVLDPARGDASFEQKITWLTEAAGDRINRIELAATAYVVVVADDADRVARHLARRAGVDVERVLDTPHALIGTRDQIVDTLQRRRDRWGISYVMLDEPFRRALEPVVHRLAGR